MLSLIHQTTGAIDGMRRATHDCNGALQQMANTQRDSLWKSWKDFLSVIQDVQIEIGQALVPAIRGFLKYATDAIRTLSKWLADIFLCYFQVEQCFRRSAFEALRASCQKVRGCRVPVTILGYVGLSWR